MNDDSLGLNINRS